MQLSLLVILSIDYLSIFVSNMHWVFVVVLFSDFIGHNITFLTNCFPFTVTYLEDIKQII